MQKDPNVDDALRELAERQFNARLAAYRDAFTSRGHGTPALRVAQNMLAFAGGPIRGDDPNVIRGCRARDRPHREANETLRTAFGTAELPEDVSPSASLASDGVAPGKTKRSSACEERRSARGGT